MKTGAVLGEAATELPAGFSSLSVWADYCRSVCFRSSRPITCLHSLILNRCLHPTWLTDTYSQYFIITLN